MWGHSHFQPVEQQDYIHNLPPLSSYSLHNYSLGPKFIVHVFFLGIDYSIIFSVYSVINTKGMTFGYLTVGFKNISLHT